MNGFLVARPWSLRYRHLQVASVGFSGSKILPTWKLVAREFRLSGIVHALWCDLTRGEACVNRAKPTYYEILGVTRGASKEEIKRAFTAKAKVLHPDKNPSNDASTQFTLVNEAWKTLSDPLRRATYDQTLGVSSPGSTRHYGYHVHTTQYSREYPSYSPKDPPPWVWKRKQYHEEDYYATQARWRSATSWAYEDEYRHYKKTHQRAANMEEPTSLPEWVLTSLVVILATMFIISQYASNNFSNDQYIMVNNEPDAPLAFKRARFDSTLVFTMNVTDSELSQVIASLTSEHRAAIETLTLNNSANVTSEALWPVLEMLPRLRTLKLKGCKGVSGEGFAELTKRALSNLEALQVTRAPDFTSNAEPVKAIANLSKLRNLTLDQSAGPIIAGDVLSSLPALISLNLISDGRPPAITEEAFRRLGSAKSLQVLELSDSQAIGKSGPDATSSLIGSLPPSLLTLSLRNSSLGDEDVPALCHLRRLQSIDLTGSSRVGDDALIAIVSQLPQLQRVVVAKTAVSDKGMERLAQIGPLRLQVLSVADCPNVTSDSLKHIPRLYALSEIRLEGTRIRKSEVVRMKREHPNRTTSISVTVD